MTLVPLAPGRLWLASPLTRSYKSSFTPSTFLPTCSRRTSNLAYSRTCRTHGAQRTLARLGTELIFPLASDRGMGHPSLSKNSAHPERVITAGSSMESCLLHFSRPPHSPSPASSSTRRGTLAKDFTPPRTFTRQRSPPRRSTRSLRRQRRSSAPPWGPSSRRKLARPRQSTTSSSFWGPPASLSSR